MTQPDLRHINCIYLHGFASGPSSRKAVFFKEQLENCGAHVVVPDLNGEDFHRMTLSSQLKIARAVKEELPLERQLVVFGSSMGGLVATLAAQSLGARKMILLAPGFNILERWRNIFDEKSINEWPEKGYLDVFHHALGGLATLSYEFVEDARTYKTDNLDTWCPTLVLHGSRDNIVPPETSISFCRKNSQNAELVMIDDDHELLSHLDLLWVRVSSFLDSKTPG